MTIMLILNAALALTIVTTILVLLGWGIVTDRARLATITRRTSRDARRHAVQPTRGGHRGLGRAPELSA